MVRVGPSVHGGREKKSEPPSSAPLFQVGLLHTSSYSCLVTTDRVLSKGGGGGEGRGASFHPPKNPTAVQITIEKALLECSHQP